MSLDVWIYAKPSEWNAIDLDAVSAPARRAIEQAVTGYWKAYPGGYEVYNVLTYRDTLEEILGLLSDVAHTFHWHQGTGTDALNTDSTFNTLPDEILAVMRDHVTYDENGDEIGRIPASFENPNWGHVFFGQKQRIFAGEFTSEFTKEFL